MTARFPAEEIRRYYERHTAGFVRLGQGGREGAIHRAVWGPGVTTRSQAFHYVDELIASLVRGVLPGDRDAHVVDLGCGVGASLCYLAGRLPISGTGVTLSPLQAQMASGRIADAGLSDRVACLEADYCHLPGGLSQADLAYAIESFVHGPSPDLFFAQCAALVRHGGLLAICDDVRRQTSDPVAAAAIDRFVRGWRINSLLHREELFALAGTYGFETESAADLTRYLETRRARDRAIAVLVGALERVGADGGSFGPLVGGHALQECLGNGWIGYDFVVFRRRG